MFILSETFNALVKSVSAWFCVRARLRGRTHKTCDGNYTTVNLVVIESTRTWTMLEKSML